jgi:hypothetical protein
LLKAAGLISVRLYKGKAVLCVEHEQWRAFIRQDDMSQHCDYNQSYANKKEHSFINLGNVSTEPYFSPAKQYRVKPMLPSFRLSVPHMQLKAQLLSLAVAFNTSDHIEYDIDLSFSATDRTAPNFYNGDSIEEEEEDSVNDDLGDADAAQRGTTGTADDQVFHFGYTHSPINLTDHPVLSKLAGGKDTATSGTVNECPYLGATFAIANKQSCHNL